MKAYKKDCPASQSFGYGQSFLFRQNALMHVIMNYARETYLPSRVSMISTSPWLMNSGT